MIRGILRGTTPRILDQHNKSVAILEGVIIGGINQYICIRGRNIENPVLLFLHGGPGDAMLPVMTGINQDLEDDFIVVNWEQRGAGKSYYPFKKSDEIDVNIFISDTYELTKLLLKRFNKEKIYIMGNSWGTAIALQAVQKYPKHYYAYIGVGQVVHMKENERLTYEYTLNQAFLNKDKKAEKQLKDIGEDYFNRSDWLKCLLLQRKYLVKYGGALYGQSNYRYLEKHFLSSPEYSLVDILKRLRGSKQSLQMLWLKFLEVDLFKTATQFEIPIYFIEGKYDYNAPTVLVSQYYESIKAPKKELIWFEKSAHFPQWEEPKRFYTILRDKIVKET
ncbi:MAG TPA: alpha/beta hydrolase [Clostridiales bacterium]|nr:alpha/beta hydrolase [Clostridiales bacterium]